ncbi:RtcB family protein [Roseicella sp. DB1501]|uniref:RtcB family protein n=1 Tax=Roseicella sp. DB1501 TaxID=2730925 RepID=UPI001493250F|nr:RtcB family protein [Roseicella sp. DB1501]NOG70480.1 RtcB family protein [Roseicella sp. DB1501]
MEKRLKVNGEVEEKTLDQMKKVMEQADYGVLCADNHLGYGHPIGGVAAYKDRISISGVGFDIACGNMAVKLPLKASEMSHDRWKELGREINRTISFGVGRVNEMPVEAEFLDTDANWENEALAGLKDLAAAQLGTVGSGNHYVDVFRDEDDFVWIGVHFGSRGLGHKATTHFLKKLGAKDAMDADPCIVDMNSDVGQAYYEAMTLGGKYAYAGRDWVCKTVSKIIQGGDHWIDEVHNHHNFAWIEEHDGDKYFVVRKGSTPAFPDQRSFIGSTMADQSVIVRGLDTPSAKENLYSTVHGAGRVLSRTQAAGKFKGWGRNRVRVAPGLIDEDAMREEMKANRIHLFGSGADEAPGCYKKLDEVLAFHSDSIAVEHRLTPIIVCMAGSDTRDPYKD